MDESSKKREDLFLVYFVTKKLRLVHYSLQKDKHGGTVFYIPTTPPNHYRTSSVLTLPLQNDYNIVCMTVVSQKFLSFFIYLSVSSQLLFLLFQFVFFSHIRHFDFVSSSLPRFFLERKIRLLKLIQTFINVKRGSYEILWG